MSFNKFMMLVVFPMLASSVANAIQCKVQGEVQIGRCALGGLLAGAATVVFCLLALALFNES